MKNAKHTSKGIFIALFVVLAFLFVILIMLFVNKLNIAKMILNCDRARVISEETPPPAPAKPKTERERLIVSAYSYLGVPYKFGGKTSNALDCSGFTKLVYADIGIKLPDGSYNQAVNEKPLKSVNDLKPGDLIFYRSSPTAQVKHITMYRGDGWIIGTGTPGQVHDVSLYPLSDDLAHTDWVLTYRHIILPDEK